jgi:Iron dependent repressor, metal binding and dimerisation domain/FeoA domain
MGMSWAEVHDEAEHLEHAVSNRVIERIDEMLGRPAVDPHGDPIPGPEGTVTNPDYDTLLTCPLQVPVMVSRVTDQDSEFLRFAERQDLKPGQVVRVEERDTVADSVTLLARDDREITIGARAASKVLVQAARVIFLCLLLGGVARAQSTLGTPSPPGPTPFAITDNSFLVEEAFNQEPGIFQNIFGAARTNRNWAAAFTQEWPVKSQKHQLSYTLLWLDAEGHNGFGDVLVNYRYQALMEGPGQPAFSPRVSLILPTGRARNGLGSGSPGLQINLPFSKQTGDWYWHWNSGVTWLPRAQADFEGATSTRRENLTVPFLAGSGIYRLRPMFQLMLEGLVVFDESIAVQRTQRDTAFTLAPGLRAGWDFGERQLVVGFAVPITWSDGEREPGAFLYCSYELPFSR